MQYRPSSFIEQQKQEELRPKRPRSKRCLFLSLIAIAVLFLMAVGVRSIYGYFGTADPHTYDPITLEPIKPKGVLSRLKQAFFHTEIKLEGQRSDRINLLLLGQGGPGHDGPFLTDTIIIGSIKPSTGQVAMISVPRDLLVDVPEFGKRKINHANALAEAKETGSGLSKATETIEKTFNIDIHYALRVDFTAFVEMIDEVGGVSIDVERAFVDSEYPGQNYTTKTISFKQGVQLMDGTTALNYARSRHGNNGEGSDFARSKRQQKIILALKEKVLSFQTLANPVKINHLIESMNTHILTNLEFADIIALLKLSKQINTNEIITLSLDNGEQGYLQNGVTSEGAFILEPNTGSFEQITAAIDSIFENPTETQIDTTPNQIEPTINYRGASIDIQNGTWQAGLASRVRKELTEKGYLITEVGNTIERPVEKSALYILNKNVDMSIVTSLQGAISIPIKELPPLPLLTTSSADIVLVLGEDYTQ